MPDPTIDPRSGQIEALTVMAESISEVLMRTGEHVTMLTMVVADLLKGHFADGDPELVAQVLIDSHDALVEAVHAEAHRVGLRADLWKMELGEGDLGEEE